MVKTRNKDSAMFGMVINRNKVSDLGSSKGGAERRGGVIITATAGL